MSRSWSVLVVALLLQAPPPPADAADGNENLAGVAVQKDGKAVLVGETNAQGTTDIAVARLTKKGALDPKFGTGGRVVLDLGGSDEGGAVAVDKRRRILVAGDTNIGGDFDFVVARLKKDGSLDPSFGTAGVTLVDFGGPNESANSIAVDRKGRILLAGFVNPSGDFQWGLARLTKNGALDTTFGTGGKVLTNFGQDADFGYGVAVDRKGAITVTGTNVAGGDLTVARYDESGTLDPDFGAGGLATADVDGVDRSYAVLLGKKRTVLVAGSSSDGISFAAARFDRHGVLDPAFGSDGTVAVPLAGLVRSAALDAKGRAYLAGHSGGFAVARLLKDGSLDPGFATGGIFTFHPSDTEIGRRIALGKRQTAFLCGESSAGGTKDMAVLLLDKKGVPVAKFNGGEMVLVDF